MSVYKVVKLHKPFDRVIEVPGSKSITNRALLLACMSGGRCKLKGALYSDDTIHFISSLRSMGFNVEISDNGDIEVTGQGGNIPISIGSIDVGSAGTAARFLTAFVGLSDCIYTVNCTDQMAKRPMKPLFDILTSLQAQITYLRDREHLPAKIIGATLADSLYGEATIDSEYDKDISELLSLTPAEKEEEVVIDVPSDMSTQFLSALLMIAPVYANKVFKRVILNVTGKRGLGSYVIMTRRMMEEFGISIECEHDEESGAVKYIIDTGHFYSRDEYEIEPDMSSASYFYAAAAITGSKVKVKGVHRNSLQGDIRFIEVLEEMGCKTEEQPDGIVLQGSDYKLKGISINMKDFSDQSMTLAAIAPFAESNVEITGIEHIRGQESDRINGMLTELRRMGIEADELDGGVRIKPGIPKPCKIETYEDHRMAMAFSLPGLIVDGIEIDNPECTGKTFGNYWDKLSELY